MTLWIKTEMIIQIKNKYYNMYSCIFLCLVEFVHFVLTKVVL